MLVPLNCCAIVEDEPHGLAGDVELDVSYLSLDGHWTDAALVWQAVQRDGVLVTFDSGVRELAGREHRDSVLVLKR